MSRYSSSPVPEPFGNRGSPRKAATDNADTPFGRSESAPSLHPYSPMSPKARPSSPRTPLYLQPDAYGSLDRAPSPRPRAFEGAGSTLGRAPSPRPGSGPLRQQGPPTPFDFLGRAGSPRGSPLAEGPQAFFPERGPSPRPPAAAYDSPQNLGSPLLGAGGSAFAPPLRAQGELDLDRELGARGGSVGVRGQSPLASSPANARR
jgi:hypothetical protein